MLPHLLNGNQSIRTTMRQQMTLLPLLNRLCNLHQQKQKKLQHPLLLQRLHLPPLRRRTRSESEMTERPQRSVRSENAERRRRRKRRRGVNQRRRKKKKRENRSKPRKAIANNWVSQVIGSHDFLYHILEYWLKRVLFLLNICLGFEVFDVLSYGVDMAIDLLVTKNYIFNKLFQVF